MTLRVLGFRGPALLLLAGFATPAPAQQAAAPAAPPAAAPFVQDFDAKPAIWKLADADTTIYLFGTIHLLPPELKWRSARLDAAIGEADELVVETSDKDFDRLDARLTQLLSEELKVKRPPLLDRLAPERRAAVRVSIEQTGWPPGMFDMMPTWMAVFALSLGGIMSDGATSEAGADSTLERLFIAANKPVTSVEDPFAVIDAIRALPDGVLVRMLEIGTSPDAAPSDDKAWATGDVAQLTLGLSEAEMGPELYAVLIRDRNRAWVEWLGARMERPGTVFFAVGAGHLAGVDSLQAMLAARGLETERVD